MSFMKGMKWRIAEYPEGFAIELKGVGNDWQELEVHATAVAADTALSELLAIFRSADTALSELLAIFREGTRKPARVIREETV